MPPRRPIESELLQGLDALRSGRLDEPGFLRVLSSWLDRGAHGMQTLVDEDAAPNADQPTIELATSRAAPDAPTTRIGDDALRYHRLRPLARGGLGIVSVAHDDALGREVAYKELRPERADDPASRARFLREAELTGRLEHPGIVPVHGLGIDGNGRPFYVMRLIRGESLRAAIERLHAQPIDFGSLEFRRLLSRLVAVCQAVEFAHRHGVIHRDIKPDNILLGPYGETLLVDWGLAKVLDPNAATHPDTLDNAAIRPTEDSTLATQAGTILGTPAYMSPEQAQGLPTIGPAADIFSLGATLYTMLTGQPPRVARTSAEALLDAHGQPLPAPRDTNPRVPYTLNAVIRKATTPDPAARYPSAHALAEDLERWLADEPVAATPEPWADRLRRWTRRHRTLAAAAVAASAVATVAFAALAAREARSHADLADANSRLRAAQAQTQAALARAEDSYRQARAAVDDALARIANDPRLSRRDLRPLRAELLGTALSYYERFLNQRSTDPTLALDTAQAHSHIGDILTLRDGPESALDAYRRAEQILRRLLRNRPNDPTIQAELATVVNATGSCLLDLGRFHDARTAFSEALALEQSLLTAGDPSDRRRKLAQVHQNLASTALQIGDSPASLDHLRRSLEIREALLDEQPDDTRLGAELASALFLRGYQFYFNDRIDRARSDWDRALSLFRKAIAAGTASEEIRLNHGALLADRATLLRQNGDLDDALHALDECERTWRDLLAESPRDNAFRLGLAQALIARADLLLTLQRIDDASQIAQTANQLLQQLNADEPDSYTNRRALAKTFDLIGRVAIARGDSSTARDAFRHAINGLESAGALTPLDHYSLACYRSLLAAQLPPTSTDREALAQAALANLRSAIAGGLRFLDHFRSDPDLTVLRGRNDFETTLADLAFPNQPFAADPNPKP